MKRFVAALLVLGILDVSAAVAQQVRGTAVSADTGAPIEGAFINLVDETGRELASTLSGADGAFSLRATAPGHYRLRVQRIGFDTWTSSPFDAGPGGTVSRELRVPVRPIDVGELYVSLEGRCVPDPGAGHELLRVWEEARKALRMTQFTETAGAIRFDLRKWNRVLEPDTWRVESEEITRGSETGRASFVSAPAEELAANGYVQRDEQSAYHFFVPDAQVLLSDVFLDDHCLRLVQGDEANASWIGIGFEPAGRYDAPDVEGVLWLDPVTLELRHIEFRYTRLDRVDIPGDSRAGGRLEFRRGPTGDWFASRWWIRIPVYRQGVRAALQRGIGGNVISQRMTTSVESYREIGGEVERLHLPDGRELALAEWGTIVGRAFGGPDAVPVAEATVRLAGTERTVRTDSAGRFQIDFVPPGRYTAVLEHPDNRLLGVPIDERDLIVAGEQVARVQLELSPARLVQRLCPPPVEEAGDGGEGEGEAAGTGGTGAPAASELALLGRVTDGATGEPLENALVWVRSVAGGEPAAVEADQDGSFLVCGLDPAGLIAQATSQGMLGRPDTVPLPESGLVIRDLVVAPITVAEVTGEATKGATLRGVVRSAESGEPVSGARVRVLGSDMERITGDDGAFVMVGVPMGRQRVLTEYLGAASDTALVDLTEGTVSLALLTLQTRPVPLPELHVEIERTVGNHRLAGYYERLERKMGDFITREDLEARDLVANMRLIQGVRVQQCMRRPSSITAGALGPSRPNEQGGQINTAMGSRMRISNCWEIEIGRRFTANVDDQCQPLTFLNGQPIGGLTDPLMAGFTGENPFSVIERIPRDMIEGIEVHRNAATAPAQYQGYGAGCGVILVWTRARPQAGR